MILFSKVLAALTELDICLLISISIHPSMSICLDFMPLWLFFFYCSNWTRFSYVWILFNIPLGDVTLRVCWNKSINLFFGKKNRWYLITSWPYHIDFKYQYSAAYTLVKDLYHQVFSTFILMGQLYFIFSFLSLRYLKLFLLHPPQIDFSLQCLICFIYFWVSF